MSESVASGILNVMVRRSLVLTVVALLASGCSGKTQQLTRDNATQHVVEVVDATRRAILPPIGSGHTVRPSETACVERIDPLDLPTTPSRGFSYDVGPKDDLQAMVSEAVAFWKSRGYDARSLGIGTDSPTAIAFENSGSQAYEYTVSITHETPPSLVIAGTIPCAAVHAT